MVVGGRRIFKADVRCIAHLPGVGRVGAFRRSIIAVGFTTSTQTHLQISSLNFSLLSVVIGTLRGWRQDGARIGGDLILDLLPKHPRRKETNDASWYPCRYAWLQYGGGTSKQTLFQRPFEIGSQNYFSLH